MLYELCADDLYFMRKVWYNINNNRLGRMSKKKNRAIRDAREALSRPTKRKKSAQKRNGNAKVNSKSVETSSRGRSVQKSEAKEVLSRSKVSNSDQNATMKAGVNEIRDMKKVSLAKKNQKGKIKNNSGKVDQRQRVVKKIEDQPTAETRFLHREKKKPLIDTSRSKSVQKSGADMKASVKAQSKKPKKRLWILLTVLATLLLLAGVGGVIYTIRKNNFEQYRADQTTILNDAKTQLAELFQDEEQEKPVRSVSEEQVRAVEERFDEITFEDFQAEKDEQRAKAVSLYEFIAVREELDGKFEEGILKSVITTQEIDEVTQNLQKLPEGYQSVLLDTLSEMQTQHQKIDELRAAVIGLFTDETLVTVRNDIVRNNYNEVMEKYNVLLQADVKEQWREKLEQVDKELGVREEEARRRAEEAWRKAEEARRVAAEAKRRQEAEIAAAWHVLNVPYHSQNLQAIYNGCETASLLMGLQFKGYLPGMNLRTYAEMIPKSDDPFQGFTYSIWDLEPKHAAHWIAPAPLAQFGRDTSGADVADITGASLDQLDAEVAAGNPVIIYLTFNYVSPKEWVEGAPRNLHVMLLTGYNSITGAQIMTDPWTQANGATTWTLSKQTVESIYNATGQRAVVIR